MLQKAVTGWWQGAIAPVTLGAKAEVGWFPASHVTEGTDVVIATVSQEPEYGSASQGEPDDTTKSVAAASSSNNDNDGSDDALAFQRAVAALNTWGGGGASSNDDADQTQRNSGVEEMEICTPIETALCPQHNDDLNGSSSSRQADADASVGIDISTVVDAGALCCADRAESQESDTTTIDVVFPPLPPPRTYPHCAAPIVVGHDATTPTERHVELAPPLAFA